MTESSTLAAVEAPQRVPRGFVPRLTLSAFGLYFAILAPLVGGLSVKVQSLVGLADAPSKLGLIAGVGALFALVSQPLAGRLSDRTVSRFGMRRPWLVAGFLGTAVSLVCCGLAPTVDVLLVAWCAAQVFANFALAAQFATVADQVPDARRGGVSGIVGVTSPLGVVAAAVLLSVLPNDFLRFAVPAVIAIPLGLWFAMTLKDRVRAEPPTEPLSLRKLFGSFVFNPRRHPDFGWAWLSKLLIILGYSGVSSYLTLFVGAEFGMDTDEQLSFNATAQIVGTVTLVVSSLLGGVVSDRAGRRKPFMIGSGLVIAVGVAVVAVSPFAGGAGLALILGAQAVMGLGAGAFFAVDQALCISLLPNPEDTAKDLGVLNIANALPQSIAPLLAGVVIIPAGNSLFHGGGYTTWFVVSAVFALAGALIVTRIRKAK